MREQDSEYGRRAYRVRLVRRLFRLGPKRKNVTFQTQKSRYYGHCYFDKDTWEAVRFVAMMYGCTLMEAAHHLMHIGLSDTFGKEIEKNNARVRQMRARGVRPTPTRFVGELIRWAEAKGYDIKRFFL